ncbi:MAG: deoxyribose-phosphate aldolase, partial [Bacilli bacterium]
MEINKMIDHTNLDQTATFEDIEKLCKEAIKYKFQAVCINPFYVAVVKEFLKDTNILVCTVVGFPNGANTTAVKTYEAIDAVSNGADEIDMVINLSALKNKDYDYVKKEIEEIRDAISGKTLKVIIETCLLTDEEIIKMTKICNETFINFIKTSTGFNKKGATIKNVSLIKENANEVLEIKASGGIKTLKDFEDMVNAGATRIGTSHGVEIMT